MTVPHLMPSPGREFLKGQTQTTTALLWSSETPAQSPQEVEAREIKKDNAISVTYDASRHCHVVRLPEKAWYEGPKADRLDRIAVRLKNTSARPQVFRLLFNSDNPAHITGLTPMIRDPQGQPTGIPVQISKNWHRREGGELLYQGPWLHAITCVRVPAAAVLDVELTIAHGWWGTLPAVSHAQLCLIGWGTDQLWDESAIGSWGESICYDPDVNLQRGMIDDVRPLMVTGMNSGQWTWTHNVGGGDFADYHSDDKGRRFLKRMRTWYRQTGPCLTDVTYAGISPDEAFSMLATVSSPRCDDIVRAYYHVRYDIHKAVAPERLELFRLGADRYNDPDAGQIAYGQGAQIVRTFPATGKDGCQQTFPLAGAGTWVALYRSGGQPAEGGWANRGMILRAWSARVGGRDGAEPVGAIIGTSQGRHASANLITGSKSFQPGDFVEFTVEMVILPARAADYYGPNENLRAHLARYGDDWQAVARQAAGNSLQVKCLTGSLERSYPPVVRVAPDQSASIEISGGLAQLPVTFTGLTDYKGYSLWIVRDGTSTRLDQSAHGNDYWQTDYDPSTGAWRQTYNVPLDTPGDARRAVILRFARIGALPDKIQGTDQGAAVSLVSEMAPLPGMDVPENAHQWTDVEKARLAPDIARATEQWKARISCIKRQVKPEQVRSLSRWARKQTEDYKAIPEMKQLTLRPRGVDVDHRRLVLEGTLDTLPSQSPLVTRWLKVYVLYDLPSRSISRTIEIRGNQTLEDLHHAIFDAFDRFDEHMDEE
jgi:hypothetical protein